MSSKNDPAGEISKKTELRRQAEEKLKIIRMTKPLNSLSEIEIRRMLHELEVHKIELEMQNDELLHTQLELETSQSRYFDLFDLAPVGYLIINDQNLILESNLAASELLGVERSNLINQKITHFILPADQDIYYLHHNQLFESSTPQTCELVMLNMSGSKAEPFWAKIAASITETLDGTKMCLGMVSDISDRKQAEQKLTTSENELRTLFEAMSNVVIVYDANGRYLKIPPTNPKNFTRTPEKMLGRSVYEILPKEKAEFVHLKIKETLENERLVSGEYCLDISGKEVWFTFNATPLADNSVLWVAQDITEHKLAEKALSESEERYRKLVEQSPDMIGVEVDQRYVYLNPAGVRLFGAERQDQLLDRPATDFIHPDDLPMLLERSKRAAQEFQLNPKVQFRIIRLDGSITEIEGQSISVTYQGKPGIQFIARDITERKKAQKNLEKTHESLSQALEASNAGIYDWNIVDNTFIWSSEFLKLFGMPRGTIAGFEAWTKALHPDDRDPAARKIQDSIDNHYDLSNDYRIVLPDGQIRWIRALGHTYYDGDRPLRMAGLCMDITTSKLADQTLQESENRFRTLFEQVAIGVALVETKTGRFVRINQKYCDFIGYTLEEMRNKTIGDVTHPDDLQVNLDNNGLLVSGKIHEFSIEKRYIGKDGREVWGNLTASPLWKPGEKPETYYHIAVVEDITKRKQAEEALKRSHNQLRSLNAYWQKTMEAERAHLARELHDEFGQSMTALKMDLTWLANRLPEHHEKIERILGMTQLIDENINLIRQIATDLRPNLLDDLGLNAALKWQAGEFSKRSNIECNLHLPEHELDLDPSLNTTLFRIFQESLTNVARHSHASLVNISLQQIGDNLVLTVRDNGRGIMEDERNNKHSLGLMGMRERAAQWEGETTISGEPDNGTTVTVRIPFHVGLPDRDNTFKGGEIAIE